MKRNLRVLAVAAAAAIAGTAPGADYVPRFDGAVRAAAQADATRLAGDTTPAGKAQFAAANKILKALDKGLNGPATFANDAKTAAKAAKTADLKLPADSAAYVELDGPSWGYFNANVRPARAALALALTAQRLSKGATKKLTKKLAAADRALAMFPAKAPGPLGAKYAALAAAATATDGFAAFDDGETYAWVLSSLTVAPTNEGFDLDDDGTTDNFIGGLPAAVAAAGIQLDLDAILAARIATSADVGVIQMWNVQSFDGDPLVFAGFLNAADTDGNAGDNFSGSETFTAANVAADGHAVIRTTTSFAAGGAYLIDIQGSSLEVAGVALASGIQVMARGTASAVQNSGLIGGAIPLQALLDFLAAEGIVLTPLIQGVLTSATDLDTDGNGSNDAFSCAFRFVTVPAVLTVP